jgi:hypothetical protein
MAITLRVHHNGDDVLLAWRIDHAIDKCRGFAIERKLNDRSAAPLPSYAGFADETWKRGDSKPSTVWPIQKFWWTDYTVRNGDTVSYRVVPMTGPDRQHLAPAEAMASKWSRPVKLDHHVSPGVACYFNRGIVASQWVQALLGKDLSVQQRRARLDKVITDTADPTARNLLAGELLVGLRSLLEKARHDNLRVAAVLFELTDQQLIEDLEALGDQLEIVLADGAPQPKKTAKRVRVSDNDAPTGAGTPKDENSQARKRLRKSKATVHDRMCHTKFLGHNKFVAVRDKADNPRWVWTGSTNWTATGLCTQANNGVLIDDKPLADRFWRQMEALAAAGNESPKTLADENSVSTMSTVDGADTRVWFTRTFKQVDLDDAKGLIEAAQTGVLFLMFQTGASGSLLESILKRRADKGFFVHGVMTTPPMTGKPTGPKPKTHEESVARRVAFVHKNERIRYAPDLLLPFALETPNERWLQEFVKKNGAHAIIHSKIVVLDPFSDHPVVMTGSHNMGKTASGTNDENLVLIEGNPALAAAYATNVIAIYDNFRWRFRVAQGTKWKGSEDGDEWQRRYLDGSIPEFAFFTGSGN